ncbi:MAG: hypothetical protein LBL16_03645 [Endomicrobium sp.]|jgi:hypothetical protein|nr:hypothetical protein [Endomicrobium sp.]
MNKINPQVRLLILSISLAIWTSIGCKSKNISHTPTPSPTPQVQPTKTYQPTKNVTSEPPSNSEEEDQDSVREAMIYFDEHWEIARRSEFLARKTLSREILERLLERSDLDGKNFRQINRKIYQIVKDEKDLRRGYSLPPLEEFGELISRTDQDAFLKIIPLTIEELESIRETYPLEEYQIERINKRIIKQRSRPADDDELPKTIPNPLTASALISSPSHADDEFPKITPAPLTSSFISLINHDAEDKHEEVKKEEIVSLPEKSKPAEAQGDKHEEAKKERIICVPRKTKLQEFKELTTDDARDDFLENEPLTIQDLKVIRGSYVLTGRGGEIIARRLAAEVADAPAPPQKKSQPKPNAQPAPPPTAVYRTYMNLSTIDDKMEYLLNNEISHSDLVLLLSNRDLLNNIEVELLDFKLKLIGAGKEMLSEVKTFFQQPTLKDRCTFAMRLGTAELRQLEYLSDPVPSLTAALNVQRAQKRLPLLPLKEQEM